MRRGRTSARCSTWRTTSSPGAPSINRGGRRSRRAGIDVVAYGNAPEALGKLDSTRIVVRRGTEAVGQRVRRALGRGRVVVQLDSARLLDASVLLGADVAPRSQFHP